MRLLDKIGLLHLGAPRPYRMNMEARNVPESCHKRGIKVEAHQQANYKADERLAVTEKETEGVYDRERSSLNKEDVEKPHGKRSSQMEHHGTPPQTAAADRTPRSVTDPVSWHWYRSAVRKQLQICRLSLTGFWCSNQTKSSRGESTLKFEWMALGVVEYIPLKKLHFVCLRAETTNSLKWQLSERKRVERNMKRQDWVFVCIFYSLCDYGAWREFSRGREKPVRSIKTSKQAFPTVGSDY